MTNVLIICGTILTSVCIMCATSYKMVKNMMKEMADLYSTIL